MARNIKIEDLGAGALKITDSGNEFYEQKGTLLMQRISGGATDLLQIKRNTGANAVIVDRFDYSDVVDPVEASNNDLLATVNAFFFRDLSTVVTGYTWSPGQIFVSPSGDDTTGTGTIYQPYATIQKGIDEASAVNEIVVLPGVYLDGFTVADEVDILVCGQVAILNTATGDPVCSASGSGSCTVRGTGTWGLYVSGTGQNVVSVVGSFELTIQGGEIRTENSSGAIPILCAGTSTLTLRDTKIVSNSFSVSAEAMDFSATSNANLYNVRIQQHSANIFAPAIDWGSAGKLFLNNVTFAMNTSGAGSNYCVRSTGSVRPVYVYGARATRPVDTNVTELVSSIIVDTNVS